MKELDVKLKEPKAEDDVQLPELPKWETVQGRPQSLYDLDPNAKQELDNVEATFLSLGDLAYLDQITTTEITDNSITTPKILAGAINASKISVGNLSAISADLGTINAGSINGITITGGTIRTSASGKRVQISSDLLRSYDSGNNERMRLDGEYLRFYDSGGANTFRIETPTALLTVLGAIGSNRSVLINGQGGSGYAGLGIGGANYIRADASSGDVEVYVDLKITDGVMEIEDGFVNLAQMSGAQASSQPGDRNGSMYYRTDDNTLRVLIGGTWRTVTTT